MPTRSSIQQPSILVVEDDASIRLALEVALAGEGYRVQAEPDGARIEKVAAAFLPDLAILDIGLPVGPDGFVLARRLRTGNDLPVVFLTARDSLDDRLAGFDIGADDYLVKPFSMAELLARVKVVLRRAGRIPPCRVADIVLDDRTGQVTRAGQPLELTRTEKELLMVLVDHPGQVLSKAQLLSQIWGFGTSDPNVVEVHMSSLRRKLEAHGPRLVHTVRAMGYVLRP